MSNLFLNVNFNTSLAAKGDLAHRLQCHHLCKIQNGCQGAPKWLTESGEGSTPRFLGAPVMLNQFFGPRSHSMRKGCDGREWKGKEWKGKEW